MDSSNNVDLEAFKQYVINHIALSDTQKTGAMAAFDSCMQDPPSFTTFVPKKAIVIKLCIDKALGENVSLKLISHLKLIDFSQICFHI